MKKHLNMDSIIAIPTSLNGKFFRYWLEFLKPIHKLSNKEMNVTALFLKKRFELAEVIKDDVLLDKNVFSRDSKQEIMEACNITLTNLNSTITSLRNAKVLIGNKINPKFIPTVTKEQNNFKLLILFNLDELHGNTK